MKILPTLLVLIAGINLGFAAEKMNILLICVDDLKPLLGCYDNGTIKSPNIDRLAKRGVVFERAYCNQAVCAPSRNSLMTGKRPQTLGIYDLGTNFRKADANAITLAQHFKTAGYRAEALGKIFHVGHGNHEDTASWSVPHWQANSIAYHLPESKASAGLTREEALFSNKSSKDLPRGAPYESADVADEAYPDGKIANEAIARLQEAKKRSDTPFFIAVGFLKPHLPFCAPKKYWDLYDAKAFVLPERRTPPDDAPSYAPQFGGEMRQYKDVPEKGALSDELSRNLIHGYHAAVSYMDAQLGKVLDALDASGLDKKTIIVLWGDHGWHLGDHGMWCKHTNYEEATRIPVLVSEPGVTAHRSKAMVETVDIFPTLCELAGLPSPAGLDGQSFAASVRQDKDAKPRTFIQHVYPRGERLGRAIRNERYRLVEWKKPGAPADTAECELYDYQADPGETKNVAASQPDMVKTLRATLAKEPEAKPQLRAGAAKETKPEAAKSDRTAMFATRDKDNDGKLTKEEFLLNQPDPDKAPERFGKFDANKDGALSREEFIHSGNPPKG